MPVSTPSGTTSFGTVPHFKKMLYDNALLSEVYLRAYQVTGNLRHADVARETLDYLCREMSDDAGGIHCSEDADLKDESPATRNP